MTWAVKPKWKPTDTRWSNTESVCVIGSSFLRISCKNELNTSCAWGVIWSETNTTRRCVHCTSGSRQKALDRWAMTCRSCLFQSILVIDDKEHFVLFQVQVHWAHPTLVSHFSWEMLYLELLKSIEDLVIFGKCLMYVKGFKSKNKTLESTGGLSPKENSYRY